MSENNKAKPTTKKYKTIDRDLVYKLAAIQCTQEEIAEVVGLTQQALTRRFGDLIEKGKNAAYDLEEKMRKKDEAAEAELKNPKHKLEDNMLGGFDSFFDKAKRFADRLEKKVEDRFPLDEDIKITKSEIIKRKSDEPSKIFGFDDLDGDGDPLIDDAIIEK